MDKSKSNLGNKVVHSPILQSGLLQRKEGTLKAKTPKGPGKSFRDLLSKVAREIFCIFHQNGTITIFLASPSRPRPPEWKAGRDIQEPWDQLLQQDEKFL